MRRIYSRKGLCITFFTLTFVVGLFLLSPLLLSRAPILDVTAPRERASEQCGENGAIDETTPRRSSRSDSNQHGAINSVLCPNPGLTSSVISSDSESWATFSKVLRQYKTFHAEKLKQLKNSSPGAQPKDVKTLTWACSQSKCSGLGDQLMRLQFFFILAMMSDRIFTIYWDEGLRRSSKYLLPNEIDWSYFDASKGMCTDNKLVFSGHDCAKKTFEGTSMWGFSWNKEEFRQFGDALFGPEQHITVSGWVKVYTMHIGNELILDPGEKIKAGFERLGLTDILSMYSNNTVQCGHRHFWYNLLHKMGAHHIIEIPESSSGKLIVSDPWLQVSHTLFCYLFKFPQVLITEVDRVAKSLGIEDNNYLAVHLRTGFKGMPYEESFATRWLLRNWKMFDDINIWDRIMAEGFKIVEERISPNAPVYLSTDTEVAKERFLKKYPGRLKVINSTATHSAFVRSKCEGQSTQTSDVQFSPSDPYMSMWIDFFLMGRAHVLMHGESSFSIAACFLSPVAHLNQVWYMQDYDKNCIASYVGGNTTCIA